MAEPPQQAIHKSHGPTHGPTTGIAARRSALKLLDAVLRRNEPLKHAAHHACRNLSERDRAFAIVIAAEVLRWMQELDALIDSATARKLADDAKARSVLRIALIQLLHLGTPSHAVVAVALPLLSAGPRRLVHAILTRAQREKWALPAYPSLPGQVAERWSASWGDAMVEAAQKAWSTPPPIDLTFCSETHAQAFGQGSSMAPRHRRLERGSNIADLPGFAEGKWWIQDLAAAIPVALLGEGKGRAALDLCAAPGGKTMQLAAAGWQVTAVDKSAKRLKQMKENLARTRLEADIVIADVQTWSPDRLGSLGQSDQLGQQFDAVLLDAPCTASGIFRRHPDVLHRITTSEIADLKILQATILEKARQWVKPGGSLIYATCSLEKNEGEDHIADFLSRHDGWAIDSITNDELPTDITAAKSGILRILPTMMSDTGGIDGFFIARLKSP